MPDMLMMPDIEKHLPGGGFSLTILLIIICVSGAFD